VRSLLLALLVSTSGSLTASSDGGSVHLALEVQCEPACSPMSSDVEWQYSVLDGGQFFTTPSLDGGRFDFDSMPPQFGTALTFTTSASCSCGALDGGSLSLSSTPLPIAPVIELQTASIANGGVLTVLGFPHGDETIEVVWSGAGLDSGLTITRAGADFTGGTTAVVLHPTEPGDLNVIATLTPWNVSTRATTNVQASVPPGHEQPKGCTTAPGFALGILGVLLRPTRVRHARA